MITAYNVFIWFVSTYYPFLWYRLRRFLAGAQGQDLAEYTLLMAFVALVFGSTFIGAGGSIKGVWGVTNTRLDAAYPNLNAEPIEERS